MALGHWITVLHCIAEFGQPKMTAEISDGTRGLVAGKPITMWADCYPEASLI